jgi:hypothetical protein
MRFRDINEMIRAAMKPAPVLTPAQRIRRAVVNTIEQIASAFRITRPSDRPGRTFRSLRSAVSYRDPDVWDSPSGQMPPADWLRRGTDDFGD